MIKKPDDYQAKLIQKILLAASHEEVRRYCHAAVHELEGQFQGYLVVRFLEETVTDLSKLNPSEQSSQQSENIITAKIFFNLQIQQYYFSHE
jgi:hypothetical protein